MLSLVVLRIIYLRKGRNVDAKGQRKITRTAYALLAAVILCGTVALFYGGCSRNSTTSGAGAVGASATQQITRAAELNGLAERENQSARAAVERADERAAEAADINQRVTQRLEGSKELLGEIRADNQRAKLILDELIADAESGRTQREKN